MAESVAHIRVSFQNPTVATLQAQIQFSLISVFHHFYILIKSFSTMSSHDDTARCHRSSLTSSRSGGKKVEMRLQKICSDILAFMFSASSAGQPARAFPVTADSAGFSCRVLGRICELCIFLACSLVYLVCS